MTQNPKVGDIVEIRTSKGLGFAHYVLNSDEYGYLLRVVGRLYSNRPSNLLEIIQGEAELFYAFYPLRAALRKGLVSVVDNVTPSREASRPIMRLTELSLSGPRWSRYDVAKDKVLGRAKTARDNHLSVVEIINHELLVDRIASQWCPANETVESDPGILQRLALRMGGKEQVASADRDFSFYLYFAEESVALQASDKIGDKGQSVDVFQNADTREWTVRIRKRLAGLGPEFDASVSAYTRLAQEFGGQYDGFEG